jgi:hypothetical protein
MRGEEDGAAFDAKLAAAAREAGMLPAGSSGVPDGPEDALAKLKNKMAEQKAAKQKALEESKKEQPKLEAPKPEDEKK